MPEKFDEEVRVLYCPVDWMIGNAWLIDVNYIWSFIQEYLIAMCAVQYILPAVKVY